MKPDLKIVILLLATLFLAFCKPKEGYRPDSGVSTGEMAKVEAQRKARKGEFEKLLLGKWELTSYNCNHEGKYCTPLKDKTVITLGKHNNMLTERFDLKTGEKIESFPDLYRLAWFQPAGQWIIELNTNANYGILFEIDQENMRLTPNGKSFDTFIRIR